MPNDLPASHPLETVARWLAEAEARGIKEPSAMALATVSPEGMPSVRFVLCRGVDERGLRFFTNYESRKARDLDASGRAAVVFHWAALERQVRVEGRVERTSAAESDAYFQSRARGSQIASAASRQSRPLGSLDELRAACDALEQKFAGEPVPRPPSWGGYRLIADAVELWIGGEHRLHDRVRYERERGWQGERLAP